MDVFGITYIIETPQQFWSGERWLYTYLCVSSHLPLTRTPTYPAHITCVTHTELDEILQLPPDATLDQLDGTLRRFVVFCSTYHGKCVGLCSPLAI